MPVARPSPKTPAFAPIAEQCWDRKIAGICAGMGHYLDLDVTLVRLVWVLVTILAGIFPGVIVYVLAWIVIPEEPAAIPVAVAGQPVTNS